MKVGVCDKSRRYFLKVTQLQFGFKKLDRNICQLVLYIITERK